VIIVTIPVGFRIREDQSMVPSLSRLRAHSCHIAAKTLVILTLALTAMPALAGDLALKRVMLSVGGVAYLEYEAQVTGNAELTLDVPLTQVDDVLKSIVVYDSQGGVGSAQLAGRDPLNQTFKDLPFNQNALNSPAELLNALQGAEIKVGASHAMVGRVLSVVPETVELRDRATTKRTRVSLLTSSGLQQFILEDIDSVSFVDPALQAKVDKALSEISLHRAKDRRQIVLASKGTVARTVRIGYVVEAALWKANFRLTLPQDVKAPKAHLQGWAVLENMSGQDWKDVELTLLSGNPVSFRQAIYEAYYVARPEVPVEVLGRLLPKPDSGVLMQEGAGARDRAGLGGGDKFRADELGRAPAAPRAKALPSGIADVPMNMQTFQAGEAGIIEKEPLVSRAANTAEAEEGATQVAFRIPVGINIGSGQSALVPIFEGDVLIERLSLYQYNTSSTRPFASLRLRNTTTTGLPPGVLTLYEHTSGGVTYVGDARISSFPAGESRLVSYAVDDKTKVAKEPQSTRAISKGAIAQGVMALTRTQRQATIYRIVAPANEARRLVLEHPKPDGWKLVEPTSAELTASAYRVSVDLEPGETKTVTIAFEAPMVESVAVAKMSREQIAEVIDTQGIDPGIKRAFVDLARLRRILADKQAAEAEFKTRIQALTSDQSRIRDNISRIDRDSPLYKRYLEKLSTQESDFEALQVAAEKAAGETREASAAVDSFIAGLTI
jgi:hypothetical protein